MKKIKADLSAGWGGLGEVFGAKPELIADEQLVEYSRESSGEIKVSSLHGCWDVCRDQGDIKRP